MQCLRNKSELNVKAATLLHDNLFYLSVVHCAYYSCIQLMKHAWLYSMDKSENDLQDLQKEKHKGSHEVLITELKIFIKNKAKDDKGFSSAILELKRLRVTSDYLDESIDADTSKQSMKLSNLVLDILNRCI